MINFKKKKKLYEVTRGVEARAYLVTTALIHGYTKWVHWLA